MTVVVERSFEAPVPFEVLVEAERAVAWCLEQHRVRPSVSYRSFDGRRVLCLYEAPDAESVRMTQVQGKLPFDAIWSAVGFGQGEVVEPDARELVIVQRRFDPPVTLDVLRRAASDSAGCLDMYRAAVVHTLLSTAGDRQFCIYRAPDAEAVRRASVSIGATWHVTWKAVVAG